MKKNVADVFVPYVMISNSNGKIQSCEWIFFFFKGKGNIMEIDE